MPNQLSHVKILFEVENEDGTTDIEGVWAVPDGTGYRLDNIPFYAREVAVHDVVGATPDPDGALRFEGLQRASGHSTIRLWFEKEDGVQAARDHLRGLGCPSELDLSRLVAVDVPPTVSYATIRAYLDGQQASGVFEYEEGCLGQDE